MQRNTGIATAPLGTLVAVVVVGVVNAVALQGA